MFRKVITLIVLTTVSLILNAEDLSSRIYLGSIPSVSSDGSFFVFEWCNRLWRASVEGGQAVALTDGTTKDIRPTLSPDSKRMAFISNRNGGWKLFEMALEKTPGLDAGEVRQISFHTENLIPRAYTSDGNEMLATASLDYAVNPKSAFYGFKRVVLLPLNRRGREKLVFDSPANDPSISPDGNKLLFVFGGVGGGEPTYHKRVVTHIRPSFGRIWLYDIKSKKFSEILKRTSDLRCPIWTPDGNGFYYMNDANGVRNIYHYSLANGAERKITSFTDDHVFQPTLSKDGRTMIIRKGFDFWRLDPTQKKPEPVRITLSPAGGVPPSCKMRRRWYTTTWNNDVNGCIDFTNEGKEIAFTTGGDLWVMDSEIRQPVRIHGASLTHERSCQFSSDGSSLYYLSDRGEGVDIYRATRADPNRAWWENTKFICTRITNDNVFRDSLSISPDDKHLAWKNRTGKIFISDTNAVVLSVSTVKATDCTKYSWSPDSKWIAASFKDAFGNNDVWIIPAFAKNDDGTPAPKPCNISRHQKNDDNPTWSSDGKILAFSGIREKSNNSSTIFYVYLDPADEASENPCEKTVRKAIEKTSSKKKEEDKKTSSKTTKVVFDGIYERVRNSGVRGDNPQFGYDPRKLAFEANGAVHTITIPDNLKPAKILSKLGPIKRWIKAGKDDKILRSVGLQPAHGDTTLSFKAYQETDVADYQELAFLSGWALLRDAFYDPNMHGTNWKAVKNKYRHAARHAPSWSVFNRVMQMMIGEIDASHQGFWDSENAKKEWDPSPSRHSWNDVTAHIGALYDTSYTNDGWKVAKVVPQSPVDRGEEGLKQGDVITSIDGIKLIPSMDVTEVMNTPLPHKFRIEYIRSGTNKVIFAEGVTYGKIHELMRSESIREIRSYVRNNGNFGYINIQAMDNRSLNEFMDSIFAEGYGKDGLIIDVRYNTGGHIADRILDILCGPSHSRALIRGDAGEGYLLSYWDRPLLPSVPIVVLCNWNSASNAEIFTHAIKTLKRGKVVGTQTAGSVIATRNIPLLDMGTIRKSYIGWFTADGTDMEFNGAKPDIEVDITPDDINSGRDNQLDTAIRVLKEEASSVPKRPPLKFAK